MQQYRETIYKHYHSNQVNKGGADHKALLQQQSYYYAKEMVPYLPSDKGAKIMDIGCGFGSFIHAAKSKAYTSVAGIDLSNEQVKVAHELGINEVKLQSADDLFKEDVEFDCIVGIDIIEHLTKDELIHFLSEIKNKLRKGGSVVFRTPNMDADLSSVYAFADISHEIFLNKSSALQVMNSVGFKRVEVYPSMIHNQNPVKELLRKVLWQVNLLQKKISLFASGRTWNDVVFTPNLIIRAYKD